MKNSIILFSFLIAIVIFATNLQAQPYISLQGMLKDASGDLLTDGNYSIEFNFYTSLAGGSSVWSETQTVTVSGGVFSVHLGSVSALSVSFENQYWVGISVESEPELSPRIMLTYSPYAMYAVAIADDAVTSEKIADGTVTAADLSQMGATAGQNLSWNGTSWQPSDRVVQVESDPLFSVSTASGIVAGDVVNWNAAFTWGDHSAAGYLINESDPLFSASAASGIIAADISNWNSAFAWGDHSAAGYLTSESDPLFSASTASGIAAGDINNWNTVFAWGDHSAAGYLTSESDPLFSASTASGIVAGDVVNWNSAFAWGDHSASGYLTSESDPLFSASTASGIVAVDITNWNSAFTWGDHSAEGYLKPGNVAGGDLSGTYPNPQIANNAVTSGKIADGTITSADIGQMGANNDDVLKWNGTEWSASVESDPVFYSHVSSFITSSDISRWYDAFSWGNHKRQGYLIGDSPAGGDFYGTQTYSYISANVVSSENIIDATIIAADLSQMGATAGQNLSWNGTSWQPANESDPLFSASAASGIVAVDISNWNSAFAWGDHSAAGYLTSESDPLFSASAASGIVAVDITNWNVAFAWGDHSAEGYIVSGGTAGGDLSGTYPNPQIANDAVTSSKIADGTITAADLSQMGASTGDVLQYNGSAWQTESTVSLISIDDLSDAKHTPVNANLFLGAGSGDNNIGSSNTALGTFALRSNTTGQTNTAIGSSALRSNTTGFKNTASGSEALYSNTDGIHNTASGSRALYSNTTGDRNTASGFFALQSNTTGFKNTASGEFALYSNTTGYRNTASGSSALASNTTGFRNTAIGYSSGSLANNNTTCTFLGYNADNSTSTSRTFSMALGAHSRATANNQVRIATSSITSIGGYAAWTNLSDARFKTDVAEEVPGMAFISKLRPVTYHMKVRELNRFLNIPDSLMSDERSQAGIAKKESITYTGFIAQEVEEAARSVGFDFSGVDAPQNDESTYGLRYAEFVVPLVKAMQEQQAVIESQNIRIAEMEAANTQMADYRGENEELRQEMMEIRSELDELKRLIIAAGENIE